MTAPPKRRWFRFSLRTMFVVVTVFGVWLGWNLKIVRERKVAIVELNRVDRTSGIIVKSFETFEARGGKLNPGDAEPHRVSKLRRCLGDETYVLISMPQSIDSELLHRIEHLFPEAEITVYPLDPKAGFSQTRFPIHRDPPVRNIGTIFKTGLIEKRP